MACGVLLPRQINDCSEVSLALRRLSVQSLSLGKEVYNKTKLRGLSPNANYTDRAAAAVRRS